MKLDLNVIGIEFSFDVKIKNPSKRVDFYRKFYGYKDYSNNGKYIYIKEGILFGIKHIRPTKSTIIVCIKDAKQIRKFFRGKNVVFNEKIVILNKSEARELGLKFDRNWNKVYEELKGNENLIFSVDF